MPDCVGVPLIVTMFAAQLPVTPVGSPDIVAPVAPVVLYVIVVIGAPIHTVCVLEPEAKVIVLTGLTVVTSVNAGPTQVPEDGVTV